MATDPALRIKAVEWPSVMLRAWLRKNPKLSNAELAGLFMSAFPEVEMIARVTIWNWRRPDGLRPNGIDDAELDASLVGYLRSAGYLSGS